MKNIESSIVYRFIISITSLLFLILYTTFVIADEKYNITGNLYDNCLDLIKLVDENNESSPFSSGFCLGYFESLSDHMKLISKLDTDINVCIPPDTDTWQLVKTFIKYVRENPKEIKSHQVFGVMSAMHRFFPCK